MDFVVNSALKQNEAMHAFRIGLGFLFAFTSTLQLPAKEPSFEGWKPVAAREEIRPAFSIEEGAGPGGSTALAIHADDRPGLNGGWTTG